VRIIWCIEDPLTIEELVAYLDKPGALTEIYRLPPCRVPLQVNLFD
jgi:hypothetical protein